MNEQELQQRIQQLEQELKTVQRTVSDGLRELKAPLTPLKAFIQTLLEDEEEAWYERQDRREFYMIMRDNIDYMTARHHELQSVLPAECKADAIQMNWEANVDIYQLINNIVARQQEHSGKHNLVIATASPSIFVEADPEKLERVLESLVSNAVKYSPEGGEVCVSVRLEPPSQEYPYDTLLLQVKDQGLGLNMEDLKKIGTLFGVRNRNKDSGWPQRFIKAHNGVLWPESEGAGKGATFNVRLPVKQPKKTGQGVSTY